MSFQVRGYTVLILCISMHSYAATITVNSLADNGPGDCATTCTLRDAITSAASNDMIVFDPGLAYPATITLNGQELLIYKSLSIAGPGPGQLAVNANLESRIVEVALNAAVNISGLTMTQGAAVGAVGAADTSTSAATNGGPAYGGAILIDSGASLSLEQCVLNENTASGGAGGPVLSGIVSTIAGSGGNAAGGAIYNLGSLTCSQCAFTNSTAAGGAGGAFFPPSPTGGGGMGGNANGGVIAGSGQVELLNSLVAYNSAIGGTGGPLYFSFPGLTPGNGGNASAGALAFSGFSVLEFVTVAGNNAVPGQGGFGLGSNGSGGSAATTDLLAGATVVVRSSVLSSGNGDCGLDGGTIVTQGANLAADNSCPGFSLSGNPNFQNLATGSNGYPILFPKYGSPVIDAAIDCDDAFGNVVAEDLQGTPRPQGPKCDIGAIEADYIFANGFEAQ